MSFKVGDIVSLANGQQGLVVFLREREAVVLTSETTGRAIAVSMLQETARESSHQMYLLRTQLGLLGETDEVFHRCFRCKRITNTHRGASSVQDVASGFGGNVPEGVNPTELICKDCQDRMLGSFLFGSGRGFR